MNKKLSFVYSTELEIGGYPPQCPFNTKRAGQTFSKSKSLGLITGKNISIIEPVRATEEELLLYHSSRYIEALKTVEQCQDPDKFHYMGIGTTDCPVFENMFDFLSLSSGATLSATKAIINNETDIVFSPSGGYHHAEQSTASGFCYINDIVLATRLFINDNKRVLIVDFDVHHCDGVQSAFYSHDDVMVISMHQDGKTLYPGTGSRDELGIGKGFGYTLNIPLPPGTYNAPYYKLFSKLVIPAIEKFKPDVIITELGMDTLNGDPLANLKLTNSIFINIIEDIKKFNVPILATGGGGYNIENTIRSWVLCWSLLSDQFNQDLSFGMGGVMLENSDWIQGLVDNDIRIEEKEKEYVLGVIEKVY